MKWTDYSKLSRDVRLGIVAFPIRADCDAALRLWNSDFPDKAVSDARFHEFLNAMGEFLAIYSNQGADPWTWARQPFQSDGVPGIEAPLNNGEFFIDGLIHFGPLCWGWRSPAKESKSKKVAKGEKGKGTLQRGVLQIFWDEFKRLHPLAWFLAVSDLRGKSAKQAAREYAKREGINNPDLESIAGAISDRVSRIENPR